MCARTKTHDVIIIGAGPAGLTAAIYCGRANLKTCVVEQMGPGGQVATTDRVENYPGFPDGIEGLDLSLKMQQQAERFDAEFISDVVEKIDVSKEFYAVSGTETEFVAPAVIVATGARPRALGVSGEEKFHGSGVSFCATCDGAFYRDKVVAVVGGGDSAISEALFLTRFAREVCIIHRRDELRATKILQDRAKRNPKIRWFLSKVVESIEGESRVDALRIRNLKDDSTELLHVDGVFLYVGLLPNTDFLKGLVEMDRYGYVATDESMKTSRPGLFAVGDLRQKELRQVVTATADGAIAAMAAEQYIEDLADKAIG